jgi:hypothetical protein
MTQNRSGYVYVWGGKDTYKIGWAKDPAKRIRDFPVMPYDCDFAYTIESDDARALEARLHDYYKAQGKHLRGEWYELSQDDLARLPDLVPDGRVAITNITRNAAPAHGPVRPLRHLKVRGRDMRIDIDAIIADMEARTGSKYDYETVEQLIGFARGTFAKWAEPGFQGLLFPGPLVEFRLFYRSVMGEELDERRYYVYDPAPTKT